MCGVVGVWEKKQLRSGEDLISIVTGMADVMEKRGPDGSGAWHDSNLPLAFGHRRLSIIDLSKAGHQPMLSSNQRYVITYNGEVYNSPEIRRELEAIGIMFRGHSDTEVILEACAAWGIHKAVHKFVGMFAFGLWDRQEKQLTLIRDRLGIKPLYWCDTGDAFLFASELKALHQYPGLELQIDHDALAQYFKCGYIPGPASIYKNVYKLMPGTLMQKSGNGEAKYEKYWDAKSLAFQGMSSPETGSDTQIEQKLHELLRDSVSKRMLSDVPVGAFLSGGIDSTLVVALMQEAASAPVNTFTIGYNNPDYNEADHARTVAKHLGTRHEQLYLDDGDIESVVPTLAELYDEPFSDSSQLPAFFISRFARSHVKVCLSGDGGDELFAGYNRHVVARDVEQVLGRIPVSVRKILASSLQVIPGSIWNHSGNLIARCLSSDRRPRLLAEKMHKITRVLRCNSMQEVYQTLTSATETTAAVLHPDIQTDSQHETNWNAIVDWPESGHPAEAMMLLDTLGYLPDDILTKVDRASMGVSLEARVPLLDHRVYEYAWQIPLQSKCSGRIGKKILRRILSTYVPENMINRPKMGFAIPLEHWLKGGLKYWAEALLDERRLVNQGLLNSDYVGKCWNEYKQGYGNHHHLIWSVLMFQAWQERYSH